MLCTILVTTRVRDEFHFLQEYFEIFSSACTCECARALVCVCVGVCVCFIHFSTQCQHRCGNFVKAWLNNVSGLWVMLQLFNSLRGMSLFKFKIYSQHVFASFTANYFVSGW